MVTTRTEFNSMASGASAQSAAAEAAKVQAIRSGKMSARASGPVDAVVGAVMQRQLKGQSKGPKPSLKGLTKRSESTVVDPIDFWAISLLAQFFARKKQMRHAMYVPNESKGWLDLPKIKRRLCSCWHLRFLTFASNRESSASAGTEKN